ncbi:MFS transporter [Actinomycetospora lutea]|uniref:MFS transporter n=1 Tax=Actinomycetospora lutea TaxID=663604 RepID=UPI002365F4EC|nr:MFS transporter [Actinomycetospora lutea]MDD7937753.1 MFS transporter [Actinomycetospora lutea]
MTEGATTSTRVRPVVVLLAVLALALNLRAALSAYPPLLETIRADLGLSAAFAGLVQAATILMMGAGSFAAPALARRTGRERAAAIGVTAIALGTLTHGLPAAVPLVVGSLAIGLGIGVVGVAITGVIRDHLPERAGTATGLYTVAMMGGATVASLTALPLADVLGGWWWALAAWTVPAVLALVVWWPATRRLHDLPGAAPVRLPWRNRFARLAVLFQAMSSVQFYGWLTWLAPFYEAQGFSTTRAAVALSVWNVVQIPAALLVPLAAERRRSWAPWAAFCVVCAGIGVAGILVAPVLPVVGPWPWIVLASVAVGAGFPLGLAVVAWRTPDGATAASVSALTLGSAYLLAALAPPAMGVLIDLAGFRAALVVILAASLVQGLAVVRLGPRRVTYDGDT